MPGNGTGVAGSAFQPWARQTCSSQSRIHPYRVMFGGFIESAAKDDHFVAEAKAAFQVLVDALVEQQNAGDIRRVDPVRTGRFVWALVDGTAMLVIDGQLPEAAQKDALEHYTFERLNSSIRQETLQAD
jgi:hypothetical protein